MRYDSDDCLGNIALISGNTRPVAKSTKQGGGFRKEYGL